MLVRPRLRARMSERWGRRLTTVVAGPGFGKTVGLLTTMEDRSGRPPGTDVWLSCEPADEDAGHLRAGLAQACGLPPESAAEGIVDWVWAQAPDAVCLVLDDVHEIPRGSAGAALMRRLVDELPGNAHVVLASRQRVPLPVARLAASGQLARIGESDLLFDEAELDAFAAARNVDPALLASSGGWPALAELLATAGADLVLDYPLGGGPGQSR